MKIRHPVLIKLVAFLLTLVVRLLVWTLRYRVRALGNDTRPKAEGPFCVYGFWHEGLLIASAKYGRPHVYTLVSGHADGKILAEVLRRYRFQTVEGSTTRGGREAVRTLLALPAETSIALTPDGPRGPRRQLQTGVVYLASRSGKPIVPVGFAFRSAWRLNSWDHFAIPKPFSVVTCIFGEAIPIPADLDRQGLEHHVSIAQTAMERITALAEEWAEQPR